MQDIDFKLLKNMSNPRELRIVEDAKYPTMKRIIDSKGELQDNITYTTLKAAEYRLFDLIVKDHQEESERCIKEATAEAKEEGVEIDTSNLKIADSCTLFLDKD